MIIITEGYFVKYRKEWLSKYDNFMLLVYIYLYRFSSIEHYVPVTIKDLVSYFKFTPDRNKGRVNDKFKAAIKNLIDMGYISFVGCYSNDEIKSFVHEDSTDKNVKYTVNDNNMIWLKLCNIDDANYWNVGGDFVKFTYSELDTILNIKGIKNVDKVASTYINIKKWISATESDTSRFVAFPSENQLSKDIGCSTKSIQEYVNQLILAKMIYKRNYGSFKRLLKGEEIKQNANTVYALDDKYLDGKYDKDALRAYLKFNYQMIGEEFEPFNKPLNEHQKNKALENISTDLSDEKKELNNTDVPTLQKSDIELFKEMGFLEKDGTYKSCMDENVEDEMPFDTEDATEETIDISSIGSKDEDIPESIRMTQQMMKVHKYDNNTDMDSKIFADVMEEKRKEEQRYNRQNTPNEFAC